MCAIKFQSKSNGIAILQVPQHDTLCKPYSRSTLQTPWHIVCICCLLATILQGVCNCMYAAAILQIACADAMRLTATLVCCQRDLISTESDDQPHCLVGWSKLGWSSMDLSSLITSCGWNPMFSIVVPAATQVACFDPITHQQQTRENCIKAQVESQQVLQYMQPRAIYIILHEGLCWLRRIHTCSLMKPAASF